MLHRVEHVCAGVGNTILDANKVARLESIAVRLIFYRNESMEDIHFDLQGWR